MGESVPPDATASVHWPRLHDVIQMKTIAHDRPKRVGKRAACPHNQRPVAVDDISAGGNSDEAGEDAVADRDRVD